jgi:hypothetical protein
VAVRVAASAADQGDCAATAAVLPTPAALLSTPTGEKTVRLALLSTTAEAARVRPLSSEDRPHSTWGVEEALTVVEGVGEGEGVLEALLLAAAEALCKVEVL